MIDDDVINDKFRKIAYLAFSTWQLDYHLQRPRECTSHTVRAKLKLLSDWMIWRFKLDQGTYRDSAALVKQVKNVTRPLMMDLEHRLKS